MTCEPNTLQWVAGVAQPLAALGTLAAVVFAARSASAASRSAAVAQQNLEAQTRPLLTPVPRGVYEHEQEVQLPGGQSCMVQMSGEILENHEEAWLSVPVRNAGTGEAVIHDVRLEIAAVAGHRTLPGAESSRRVQPGEEIRVLIAVGRHDTAYERFGDQLAEGAGLIFYVVYSDYAGRQRQRTAFVLERAGGRPWQIRDSWTLPEAA